MAASDHPTEEPPAEVSETLAEMARILFAAGSLEGTLQATVDLAVDSIDGCDYAGIFVIDGDVISTPAHSDPFVIEVDVLQHQAGEGPCLDVIAGAGTVYSGELAEDTRWPRFGPMATSRGVRSALAISLSANGVTGALNLYCAHPQAFGVVDRSNGDLLATLAGIAMSNSEALSTEERRVSNLRAGLISREVIGQAQGILMEREQITSDQAFDILRRASQRLNIKLRDVAQNLVDSRVRPETEETPPSTSGSAVLETGVSDVSRHRAQVRPSGFEPETCGLRVESGESVESVQVCDLRVYPVSIQGFG